MKTTIRQAIIWTFLALWLVLLNSSVNSQEYVRFVNHFKWSPDGVKLAIASNLGLEIYDPATDEYLLLDAQSTDDAAWSPDGSRLVSISLDEQLGLRIQIWDVASNTLLNTFIDRGAIQNIQSVDWSPVKDEIAVSGVGVRIWDVNTGQLINTIESRQYNETLSVSYNTNGTQLAFLSSRQINIWDLQTNTMTLQIPLARNSTLMAWSPDGSKVLAGNNPNEVAVFDAITGQTIVILNSQQATQMQWESEVVITSGDGPIRVWDATTFQILRTIPNTGVAIGLSSDGFQLAYESNLFTQEINVARPLAAILSGQVWQDSLADGLRAPDEAPLSAIPVSLLDSAGGVIQSTTTDDQGRYRFEADPDQTYSVEVGGNLRLSLANMGGDDAVDSDFDPLTRRSETFTPAIAEQITLDAGLLPEGALPFREDFESGLARWLPGGTWAASDEAAQEGSFALSDSPGGPAQPGESIIELAFPLDFRGVGEAQQIRLSYWTRYDFYIWGNGYDLPYVEISTDEGQTWGVLDQPITLRPDGINRNNQDLTWFQREVNLSLYRGQQVRLRFRLQTQDYQPLDGWGIDDLRVEALDYAGTLPFQEDFEAGTFLWETQGNWQRNSQAAQEGQFGVRYTRLFFSANVENAFTLISPLDLGNVPDNELVELHYWTRYSIFDASQTLLEVSTDRQTWTLLDNPQSALGGLAFNRWQERVLDLGAYRGQNVWLRFRLEGPQSNSPTWEIDNLQVNSFPTRADLVVDGGAFVEVEPMQVGSLIFYEFGMNNRGPQSASQVILSISLPTGIAFDLSSLPSECQIINELSLECRLETLDSPGGLDFFLPGTILSPLPEYSLIALVQAAEDDPNLDNNLATISLPGLAIGNACQDILFTPATLLSVHIALSAFC
jgi:Tol biopolymer transport system component